MMNLGTQTGSLVNHMMSRVAPQLPEIGEAATLLSFTDRSPATVVETFTRGKFQYVVVQADDFRRIDKNGLSESQTYEYTPNPDGYKSTFRMTDTGWQGVYRDVNTGRFRKTSGGIMIGRRDKYYDPSF